MEKNTYHHFKILVYEKSSFNSPFDIPEFPFRPLGIPFIDTSVSIAFIDPQRGKKPPST